MTDLLKPADGPTDNFKVAFGSDKVRFWLEVFNEREAEVVKQTAEAALGAEANVVIERMIYAIYRTEPEGTPDKIWDYCYNRSDAMELRGLIWDSTRYNNQSYYWKYVTRETLEQQL